MEPARLMLLLLVLLYMEGSGSCCCGNLSDCAIKSAAAACQPAVVSAVLLQILP